MKGSYIGSINWFIALIVKLLYIGDVCLKNNLFSKLKSMKFNIQYFSVIFANIKKTVKIIKLKLVKILNNVVLNAKTQMDI